MAQPKKAPKVLPGRKRKEPEVTPANRDEAKAPTEAEAKMAAEGESFGGSLTRRRRIQRQRASRGR